MVGVPQNRRAGLIVGIRPEIARPSLIDALRIIDLDKLHQRHQVHRAERSVCRSGLANATEQLRNLFEVRDEGIGIAEGDIAGSAEQLEDPLSTLEGTERGWCQPTFSGDGRKVSDKPPRPRQHRYSLEIDWNQRPTHPRR